MKLYLVAFAVLASLSLPAVAQNTTADNFTMPCSQILKLGLDKFMDEYSKQTKDYSTAGQNHGYEIYTDCKRKDNESRAKTFGATRKQQLASIRKNLNILETSCWGMQQMDSGGGTMWNQFSFAAQATREDFYGSLITSLNKQQNNSAARRKTNRLFLSTRNRLRQWQKPRIEEYENLSAKETKIYYSELWNKAHAAIVSLQQTARALPDSAAQNLAQHVDSATSSSLEFDEN